MTPLQASVLLNEAIELLETTTKRMVDDESQGSTKVWAECEGSLARLRSFRDGFFRHIRRTQNNHPVKVPAVPRDSRYLNDYTGMLTRDLDDRDS